MNNMETKTKEPKYTEFVPRIIGNVVMHPLVLLNAVDHFTRIGKSNRVVGILLGDMLADGTLNVSNSFAVPFEEDEKDPTVWFLDQAYALEMHEMFKKVNAKEKIVGWYHTGPKLSANDLGIDSVIRQMNINSVLAVIDVRGSGSTLPVEVYVVKEEIRDDGTPVSRTFENIPVSMGAEEAEEVGVEHLLRDVVDRSVGSVTEKVESHLLGIRELKERLALISNYLRSVRDGTLPLNHEITASIQNIFNIMPDTSSKEFVEALTILTNDQLMVMHTSYIGRGIISLQNLIDNKLMNKRVMDSIAEKATAKHRKKKDDEGGDKNQKNWSGPDAGGKPKNLDKASEPKKKETGEKHNRRNGGSLDSDLWNKVMGGKTPKVEDENSTKTNFKSAPILEPTPKDGEKIKKAKTGAKNQRSRSKVQKPEPSASVTAKSLKTARKKIPIEPTINTRKTRRAVATKKPEQGVTEKRSSTKVMEKTEQFRSRGTRSKRNTRSKQQEKVQRSRSNSVELDTHKLKLPSRSAKVSKEQQKTELQVPTTTRTSKRSSSVTNKNSGDNSTSRSRSRKTEEAVKTKVVNQRQKLTHPNVPKISSEPVALRTRRGKQPEANKASKSEQAKVTKKASKAKSLRDSSIDQNKRQASASPELHVPKTRTRRGAAKQKRYEEEEVNNEPDVGPIYDRCTRSGKN